MLESYEVKIPSLVGAQLLSKAVIVWATHPLSETQSSTATGPVVTRTDRKTFLVPRPVAPTPVHIAIAPDRSSTLSLWVPSWPRGYGNLLNT